MGPAKRLATIAALCALSGCGGGDGDVPKPDPVRPPDELSRSDAATLLGARENLGQAQRTVRMLRRSPARARELHAEVREVVSGGALESNELDDFGKAALGELGLAVPSLVQRDADGVPKSLDRRAVAAFLTYAERDPARALVIPAREEVATIEKTIEAADAGAATRIPPKATESLDLTVGEYLRDAEGTLAPAWPRLGERLGEVREGLAGSAAS